MSTRLVPPALRDKQRIARPQCDPQRLLPRQPAGAQRSRACRPLTQSGGVRASDNRRTRGRRFAAFAPASSKHRPSIGPPGCAQGNPRSTRGSTKGASRVKRVAPRVGRAHVDRSVVWRLPEGLPGDGAGRRRPRNAAVGAGAGRGESFQSAQATGLTPGLPRSNAPHGSRGGFRPQGAHRFWVQPGRRLGAQQRDGLRAGQNGQQVLVGVVVQAAPALSGAIRNVWGFQLLSAGIGGPKSTCTKPSRLHRCRHLRLGG
jgi:hypothetical protein